MPEPVLPKSSTASPSPLDPKIDPKEDASKSRKKKIAAAVVAALLLLGTVFAYGIGTALWGVGLLVVAAVPIYLVWKSKRAKKKASTELPSAETATPTTNTADKVHTVAESRTPLLKTSPHTTREGEEKTEKASEEEIATTAEARRELAELLNMSVNKDKLKKSIVQQVYRHCGKEFAVWWSNFFCYFKTEGCIWEESKDGRFLLSSGKERHARLDWLKGEDTKTFMHIMPKTSIRFRKEGNTGIIEFEGVELRSEKDIPFLGLVKPVCELKSISFTEKTTSYGSTEQEITLTRGKARVGLGLASASLESQIAAGIKRNERAGGYVPSEDTLTLTYPITEAPTHAPRWT